MKPVAPAEMPVNGAGSCGARPAAGPLVVDLDGSLVTIDTSLLCAIVLCRRPLRLLRGLAAWRRGRAGVKQELAASAALDAARLPYHAGLLAYLRDERAAGRKLLLATGADRRIAAAVAEHLALFDAVLASDGRTNLTGRAKLAAIRRTIGDGPFSYVGNSRADLAVWRAAARGICVNTRPRVAREAAGATLVERSFPAEEGRLGRWLRAIRRR